MKHSRRMILVPEDVFARYEQEQKLLKTSPLVTNLMQKDTDMTDVLQRTDIDDTKKQKLFYSNLECYLDVKRQKDEQIPTVQLAAKDDGKNIDVVLPKELTKLSDSTIVENIPKTMRPRAALILNRLKARPDVISWDNTGQVTVDGSNIPHSNISDLISDAVRGRKKFNPVGSKVFFVCYQR